MAKFEVANPDPKISNGQMIHLRTAATNSRVQQYLGSASRLAQASKIDFYWDEKNYSSIDYEIPTLHKDVTQLHIYWSHEYEIDGKTERKQESLTIPLDAPISLFGTPGYSNYGQHNTNTFHIDLFQERDQTQVLETVNKLRTAKTELRDKRRQYEQQIRSLLNECTTLKQLLDIWSAAESLVPSEYIQRMRIKVTRAARAKEIKQNVSFDATLANQTILTAKVLGG